MALFTFDAGKGDSLRGYAHRGEGHPTRDMDPRSAGRDDGSGPQRSSADLDRAMRNIEDAACAAGPDVDGPGLG